MGRCRPANSHGQRKPQRPPHFCMQIWLLIPLEFLRAIPSITLLLLGTIPATSATFSWPRARIPFEDDPKLTADPDMAVALNNARMDLQVRTCVRLVPRRGEQDYVYFSDLGPHIECWNMFEPFPPKGRILVNAGTSCLEPMRRPHRPKRVFSECDIEYVNHLYNCPRRRKTSPICPSGRLIMARPSDLAARSSTPAGIDAMGSTAGAEENEGENPIGEGSEALLGIGTSLENQGRRDRPRVGDEESTTANNGWTTSTHFPDNGETLETEETAQTEAPSEPDSSSTKPPDNELAELASSTAGEWPESSTGGEEFSSGQTWVETTGMPEEEATTVEETTESSTTATTITPRITSTEPPTTTMLVETTTAERTTTVEWTTVASTEPTTVMEPEATTIAEEITVGQEQVPSRSMETRTDRPPPWSSSRVSTTGHPNDWTTGVSNKGGAEDSSTMPDEPPATARSETRQPYPMMMTLITTTTTTTIAPPPPDWVRSVEESFRTGERLNSGEHGPENSTSNTGDDNGWRPLSTMSTRSPSLPEEPPLPTGPPEPKPIRPENGDGSGGIDGSSGREEDKSDNREGGRRKGVGESVVTGGRPVTVLGVIELPPGAAISIREKTKVTKLVEKTKYIGPCGSACTYGGQLVRLYRSFNSNPQVTDHFYTTERLEQHLMASQGFLMEPSMGFLGRNQVDPNCSCIRPLYRLYSAFAKDHFLTSNDQEKNVAETFLGYTFERILGYCTKEPGCGAYLPLYRFFNAINKDHFYTVDQQEMHYYKTHTELAYGFEKIECYVWQHSASAKGCPALTLDVQEERRREDHDDFGSRADDGKFA